MALACALRGAFLVETDQFHCGRIRVSAGIFGFHTFYCSSETDKDSDQVQEAYRAYVEAWKLRDIPALHNVISDDYMAVNFQGKVSDKENEIAIAKEEPEWISMTVNEIHTRTFGNRPIAKEKRWRYPWRKGAIPGSLGETGRNLATC
jgi:hypothetical protein